MKKLLIICIGTVALAGSVKAQNNPVIKQRRPTFSDPVQTEIKIDTSVKALSGKWRQDLKDITVENLTKTTVGKRSAYDDTIYSNMPVLGLNNNKHRMPVAKPDDTNMRYTMPVKRIEIMDIVKKTKTIDHGVKF